MNKHSHQDPLIEKYKAFEQSFSILIRELRNGTYKKTTIDLSGVPLTSKHIYRLAAAFAVNPRQASKITHIDLSYTGIKELPADILKDCDALTTLNLAHNDLSGLPNLPDRPAYLQYLLASHNPLNDLPKGYFINCISLQTVYLDHTKIVHPPEFPDSLSLAILCFNNSPIKSFSEKYFAIMFGLRNIFLQATSIKTLPDFSQNSKLSEVWAGEDFDVSTQDLWLAKKLIKSTPENAHPVKKAHNKHNLFDLPLKTRQEIYAAQEKVDAVAQSRFVKTNKEFSDLVAMVLENASMAIKEAAFLVNINHDLLTKGTNRKILDEHSRVGNHTADYLDRITQKLEAFIATIRNTANPHEFDPQIKFAKEVIDISKRAAKILHKKSENSKSSFLTAHRKARVTPQLLENDISTLDKQITAAKQKVSQKFVI